MLTRISLVASSPCVLALLITGCGGGSRTTHAGDARSSGQATAKIVKEGKGRPLDMAKFAREFAGSERSLGEVACPPKVAGGIGAKFVCSFSSPDYGAGVVTVTQVSDRQVIRTSINGKLGKTVNTSFTYTAPGGSSGGKIGRLTHTEGGFLLEE